MKHNVSHSLSLTRAHTHTHSRIVVPAEPSVSNNSRCCQVQAQQTCPDMGTRTHMGGCTYVSTHSFIQPPLLPGYLAFCKSYSKQRCLISVVHAVSQFFGARVYLLCGCSVAIWPHIRAPQTQPSRNVCEKRVRLREKQTSDLLCKPLVFKHF